MHIIPTTVKDKDHWERKGRNTVEPDIKEDWNETVSSVEDGVLHGGIHRTNSHKICIT